MAAFDAYDVPAVIPELADATSLAYDVPMLAPELASGNVYANEVAAALFATGANDTNPPVVSNVVPTPGTPLAGGQSIFFDVVDTAPGLRAVVVWILFRGLPEPILAFDGTNFVGRFAGSIRTVIPNGYTFNLRMAGGWIGAIDELRVRAYDQAGNEAV